MPVESLFVILAAFSAGLVDAMVGGGGLILVPTLFSAYPGTSPATLFGTNKSASIWGTLFAAIQYQRRIHLDWQVLTPAAVCALTGSLAGAWAVTRIDPEFLRRLLPFILLLVLLHTLRNKALGTEHQPTRSRLQQGLITSAIGFGVGSYDGFFGPGTGSFFIFLLVRLLGYDFLHASAAAKILNVATNLSAILLFASHGHIWWHIGLMMAIANIAGSLFGTKLALRHGSGLIRKIFLLVVSSLILKSGIDAFG